MSQTDRPPYTYTYDVHLMYRHRDTYVSSNRTKRFVYISVLGFLETRYARRNAFRGVPGKKSNEIPLFRRSQRAADENLNKKVSARRNDVVLSENNIVVNTKQNTKKKSYIIRVYFFRLISKRRYF